MHVLLWLLLLHNLLIPVTAQDQCSLEEKVAIVMGIFVGLARQGYALFPNM